MSEDAISDPRPPDDTVGPPAGPPREVAFEFSGTGVELFRIWIVNVLLTVLTVGVYSAWAKVRTRRYLYRRTRLDGSEFDYLANPWSILRGRAILGAFVGLYLLSGLFAPGVNGLLLAGAFLVLTPWVVIQAMAFNLGNTTWRGIRFGFDSGYWLAWRKLVGGPILYMLFSLLYPLVDQSRYELIVGQARFGTTSVSVSLKSAPFFVAHFTAAAIGLAWIVLMVPIYMFLQYLGVVIGFVTAPLAWALAYGVLKAMITNYVLTQTTVGPHALRSTMKPLELGGIYAGNALVILFTLGLAIPWAKIRAVRYRLDHLKVIAVGSLEEFAAGERSTQRALGTEAADFLGVDLGF